jgi:hypothetical protein
MDEIEIQIVANCMARGLSYWVPLLRYQIERDHAKALADLQERASHLNGAEHD